MINCIHLRDQNMTYFQHFKQSMTLSCLFLKGSIMGCFHAIFPCYCTTSSTDIHEQVGVVLNH